MGRRDDETERIKNEGALGETGDVSEMSSAVKIGQKGKNASKGTAEIENSIIKEAQRGEEIWKEMWSEWKHEEEQSTAGGGGEIV